MNISELLEEYIAARRQLIKLSFKSVYLTLYMYAYIQFMRLLNKKEPYNYYLTVKDEFWMQFSKNYQDLKLNLKKEIFRTIYVARLKFYLWLK